MTDRLHSAETLCYGMAHVDHRGDGDAGAARKRELEEKIKVTMFRVFCKCVFLHITLTDLD